jgi:hypothetical protein
MMKIMQLSHLSGWLFCFLILEWRQNGDGRSQCHIKTSPLNARKDDPAIELLL